MFAMKVERLLPPRDRARILRKTRAQRYEVPRPLEQESRSSEPVCAQCWPRCPCHWGWEQLMPGGRGVSGCALSKVARWQGAACWAREWPAQAWALFAGICSLRSGRQVTRVIFRFKPSCRSTGGICHLAQARRRAAELEVHAQRTKPFLVWSSRAPPARPPAGAWPPAGL